jgi:hypothetical protein
MEFNMTIQQDLTVVKNILTVLQPIFGAAVDVHGHTAQIGAETQKALKIDIEHNCSKNTALFNDIEQEILFLSNHNANVKTVLNSIRTVIGRTEGETGLNISDLLIRTWDLAKQSRYSNACDQVIYNLEANIIDAGGCLAGIAGRLAQPYLALLQNILEGKMLSAYQPNASHHELDLEQSQDNNDWELEEAIRLSSQYHPTYRLYGEKYEDSLTEEEQLKFAMALSTDNQFEDEDEDLRKTLEMSVYHY